MPQFTWYIDEDVLENTKTFPEALGQTLELELSSSNVNKTLKCEVLFKEVNKAMEQEEVLDFLQQSSFIARIELQGLVCVMLTALQ